MLRVLGVYNFDLAFKVEPLSFYEKKTRFSFFMKKILVFIPKFLARDSAETRTTEAKKRQIWGDLSYSRL